MLIKLCLNVTYNKAHIGKHLCDVFPIWNYLIQDTLLPLIFNLTLDCVSRRV